VELAAAVIGAVVAVILAAFADLPRSIYWGLVLGLGLLAAVTGCLAARTAHQHPDLLTTVGTGLRAKGNVVVQRVRVGARAGESVRVGTNVKSGGDVEVKDIAIGSPSDEENRGQTEGDGA
jgi:hypothetical protein